MRLPVLVMAGSREGRRDPMALMQGVPHKSLIAVAGVPLIDRVVNALKKVREIGPIWICAEDKELFRHQTDVRFVPAYPSLLESVENALKIIGTPCLITTSDHALLQPEWIEEFLKKIPKDCDVAVAVALEKNIHKAAPETKRTYLPFSDMRFSACNLFWIGEKHPEKLLKLWGKLQKFRKNPLKMAYFLGLPFLWKAVNRKVTSVYLRDFLHLRTGWKLCFIPLTDGRAAIDVDKPEDLLLVTQLLLASPQPSSPV